MSGRLVRKGLSREVTLRLKYKGCEGASYTKRCRKRILGRGSSKEISLWRLRVLRNRKEVHMT